MTASRALERARNLAPGERLGRYETVCDQRGACGREPLANDPGRWTWCPDCLTVYDDHGNAVNRIRGLPMVGEAPDDGLSRGNGRATANRASKSVTNDAKRLASQEPTLNSDE